MTLSGGLPRSCHDIYTPTRCPVQSEVVGSDDGLMLHLSTTTTSALSQNVMHRPVCRHGNVSIRGKIGSAQTLLCILLLLIIGCCAADAVGEVVPAQGKLLQSTLERLARKGEIVVDRRPSPHVAQLQRRQVSSTSDRSTSTSADSTPTLSPSTTLSGSDSSTSPTLTTDQDADTNSPLPSPFDTNLGNNFTSNSCPDFFKKFLASSEFQSCLPFSLLLQVRCLTDFLLRSSITKMSIELRLLLPSSTEPFPRHSGAGRHMCRRFPCLLSPYEWARSRYPQRHKLRTRLPESASACIASLYWPSGVCTYLSGRMSHVVNEQLLYVYLPLVWFTFGASQTNAVLSSAGFADAITNSFSPSDSYVYYLPLGLSLPGGARPSYVHPQPITSLNGTAL